MKPSNLVTISKYWHIFWFFRKVTLMKMMEYRTDFFFWTMISLLWTFFNLFFFSLLIGLQPSIAGWSYPELFLVQSTFMIIDAFTWSFFFRNMRFYTQSVFSGFLDFMLTRPINTQFILTTQDNSYTNLFRLLIGILTLGWSISQLPYTVSLFQMILYVVLLGFSLVLIYSIWFFFATFAFYVEKLNNINEIFPALRDVFRMPRVIYTGTFSILFSTVLPLLLITSIPTEVLTQRGDWRWILYFMGITVVFFYGSRQFFLYSLKKYSSVGS